MEMELENTADKERIGQVSLPFGESQFKDFIVSLLGKPQTISKRFRGHFQITKEDIITIHDLLSQRINQQNDSKLIQFRATVYYNDNSTITLNGFDHLVHYNDNLPIVSKGVHLTWQYLIKFRDKESFEKQEITVSFITEMDGRMSIDEDFELFAHDNQIYVRIQHTARTWGADIEGLLSKHLKTVIKKESKFLDFFRFNTERVENLLFVILFTITTSFSLYLINHVKYNMDSLFWIHYYAKITGLFIGITILYKLTKLFLEEFEVYSKPSFVLLTKESLKDKDKQLKKYKREWLKYFWSIILSIVLSIAGNYIFSYLTTK